MKQVSIFKAIAASALFIWLSVNANSDADFGPENHFPTLINNFERIVTAIDYDDDRQLSRDELFSGFYQENIDQDLYSSIASMGINFHWLSDPKTKTITTSQLIQAQRKQIHLNQPNNHQDDMVRGMRKDRLDPERRLFKYGLDSIHPNTVFQGKHSNCTLVAAIASLSQSRLGKRQIINSIEDLQDGTAEVRLIGTESGSYVVVDMEQLGRQNWNATADNNGLWLSVLEKGIALQMLQDGTAYQGNSTPLLEQLKNNAVEGQYSKLDGISTYNSIYLLTGQVSYSVTLSYYSQGHLDDLDSLFSEIINNSQVIVAGISVNNKSKLYPELPRDHSYSVLGYNTLNREVILRNPWGKVEPYQPHSFKAVDGIDDGVFSMPLDEFSELFDNLDYSEPEETAL